MLLKRECFLLLVASSLLLTVTKTDISTLGLESASPSQDATTTSATERSATGPSVTNADDSEVLTRVPLETRKLSRTDNATGSEGLPPTTRDGELLAKAVLEKEETAPKQQTYKEAEKEIADYVNSILRSILPQVVGGSGGAKLSPRCTAGMMKVFGYVRRMKGWTLKMLDSMAKPSAGILKGTAYSMGSYDECLDLSVSSKGLEVDHPRDEMFRGKYCRVKVQFPDPVIEMAMKYHQGLANSSELGKLKDIIEVVRYIPVKGSYMGHFLGLCFPSSCTNLDLEELVKLIPFPGTASVDRCEVKATAEVDGTQIIIICIFLVLILLVSASTFLDWALHARRRASLPKEKKCVSVSVAFSFCNNAKRLMQGIEEGESLQQEQSVRGIVVAAVVWTVLGHTYLYPNEGYYLQMSSLDNLRHYWDEGYFSVVMNFPLAIDALFVSYGFILTFSLWQPTLKDRDIDINFISLIVRNYIWLCLPLLLFFGVVLLLPLIGSGPLWGDLLLKSTECCRENAAAHFGMYSNFLDPQDQCFPHLWVVSCLAQLTLVGIFLSGIFARSLKTGISVTLLLLVVCTATVAVVTFSNSFPPAYVGYFAQDYSSWFWKINMAFPMSHFGAYAAGMVAGITVARRENRRPGKCLALVGWLFCLGMLYAIHLVPFNQRDGPVDSYWSALYAGVHRTAFGMCVAWVMVACSYGMGGFVNSVFSWRIFDPLFRLSYYAYIFHLAVIGFVVGVAREHFAYGHLELVLRASSFVAATYFISYILYMILEMPLMSLKDALCPKRTFQLEVTTLNNFPMHPQNVNLVSKNAVAEGTCKVWSISESHNKTSH